MPRTRPTPPLTTSPPASFSAFADLIAATDPDRVASPAQIPDGFLLARADKLGAHYIPFDYVNRTARLVLVGISPGFVQWRNAALDAGRILHGIPHPSGANAERIAYFLGRKDRAALSSRTNGAQIDADRLALRARMAALGVT